MSVSYIRVTYPPPECFYCIPAEWDPKWVTVKHGNLYYYGHRTMIEPKDFVTGNETIEFIHETHMEYEEVHEFMNE